MGRRTYMKIECPRCGRWIGRNNWPVHERSCSSKSDVTRQGSAENRDDDTALKLLKECALAHLKMHGEPLTHAQVEELTRLNTYDLFIRVYDTMKDILEQRIEGKLNRDFERFHEADWQLWERGHALMTFACAERLGWMKDLQLTTR